MFSATIPRITLPFSADRSLLAIGNTTWQTKNIAAVSIGERELTFGEAEPRHADPKPSPTINWALFGIGLIAIFMFTIAGDGGLVRAIVSILLVIGIIWFIRFFSHRNRMNEWSERSIKVSKAHETWTNLRDHVPKVYTLVLDTSSGKSVALTTFKVEKVQEIKAAILFAMSSESDKSLSGNLEALNVGSQNLDELYAKYCRRQILQVSSDVVRSKPSTKK
jgi:Family of unknown function (DUF6232)